MKNISEAAKLSVMYTNHCVRVTSIVNMKAGGAEDRKICAVSGHRNVQSLQSYDRPNQKDVVSLAKAIGKENEKPVSSKSEAPVQKPSSESEAPVQMPPPDIPLSTTNSLVSAAGSTWSNVTINVLPPQPEKRKNRLSLKLKKKPKKEREVAEE